MPGLTDALRAELADTVERILAPELDLQALAREMHSATDGIRTRSWTAARAAGIEQMTEVNRVLRPVNGCEPDLTLLTADAGSPVYMRRWWLRRVQTDDGHGRDGLYVHVFENDDPEGFHDHPRPSASLLLCGGPVFEDTPQGTTVVENRSVVLRPAARRHRIRLHRGPAPRSRSAARIPATTLFATGPRVRQWGFEQPDGNIKPVAGRSRQVPRR